MIFRKTKEINDLWDETIELREDIVRLQMHMRMYRELEQRLKAIQDHLGVVYEEAPSRLRVVDKEDK